MSHELFLEYTLAYRSNRIEPGIDKRDNKLKFWHTEQKAFVPIKTTASAMAAMDYCVFAMTTIPLN